MPEAIVGHIRVRNVQVFEVYERSQNRQAFVVEPGQIREIEAFQPGHLGNVSKALRSHVRPFETQ